MEELARQAGWAKTFGLPLELVSAEEAQRLFPPMSTDGVLGAAYLPTDGYIDPSQLTYALAEGARRRGAEIYTNTRVTAIDVERSRVTGVETDRGRDPDRDRRQRRRNVRDTRSARLAGVNVPVIPMAHEYLITQTARHPARRADDARSFSARLLPRRVRRPRHGRLRARTRRRGASMASRRTSTASCSPRTGRASRS